MIYRETRLSQGGLMRCCLETLSNHIKAHSSDECTEGEILDCAYEKPGNKTMILKNGTWQWNHV